MAASEVERMLAIGVSWNELVRRLRKLGFEGPYLSSGPHPYFMKRGDLTVDLPNPHKQDIGVGLLTRY